MKSTYIVIFVTASSAKEADAIGVMLLKKKLIACYNMMPGVVSKFWWKGKVAKAKETMLLIKTKRANFKKIEGMVRRLHSYEVPEIIAVPVLCGNKEYLSWISANTR